MTTKAITNELQTAVQLLTENVRGHLDTKTQAAEYNLNRALIHICHALEKIADQIHTLESQASRR
jgi:hypothetical protein